MTLPARIPNNGLFYPQHGQPTPPAGFPTCVSTPTELKQLLLDPTYYEWIYQHRIRLFDSSEMSRGYWHLLSNEHLTFAPSDMFESSLLPMEIIADILLYTDPLLVRLTTLVVESVFVQVMGASPQGDEVVASGSNLHNPHAPSTLLKEVELELMAPEVERSLGDVAKVCGCVVCGVWCGLPTPNDDYQRLPTTSDDYRRLPRTDYYRIPIVTGVT